MKTILSINALLNQKVPLYNTASTLALQTYNSSLNQLNQVYSKSSKKIRKVKKASNQLKEQACMILCQSAEQIIDYVEEKLSMPNDVIEGKDKISRVKNIINLLKQEYLIKNLTTILTHKDKLLENSRRINETYFLPAYIKLRATLTVSRQILMETLAERLGQLKMTYTVSKDSVTLFFSGQFNKEKVMQKITQNMTSFKNLTVNFVQKGFQVKMQKKQFFQNFMLIYERLSIVMTQMSAKRVQKWNQTKNKTITLYNSILKRIKEKQVEIKIEYFRQTRGQIQAQKSSPVTTQLQNLSQKPATQPVQQVETRVNTPSEANQ